MTYDEAMKKVIEYVRDSVEDDMDRIAECRDRGQNECANIMEETADEVSSALEIVEEEFFGVQGYTEDGTPIL